MKTVVVSIGGSVILSDEADAFFLKKLTTLFKKIPVIALQLTWRYV